MTEKILVVDDDAALRELLVSELSNLNYLILSCPSAAKAIEILAVEQVSLVITDIKMGGMDGLELCEHIVGNFPNLPVLILTAFGTLDTAIQAIRAGAFDFVVKPVNLVALALTAQRAVQNYRAKEQIKRLESTAQPEIASNSQLIGESEAIKSLRAIISQITDLDTSVLITGESGTGKELVARILHSSGIRKLRPFVVAHCQTNFAADFESQLFGSASVDDSKESGIEGHIHRVRDGTLFFDGIEQLSLELQSSLLRLFEQRSYRPLYDRREQTSLARMVVATNQDLSQAVVKGVFRQDLFFRINVIHLHIPPLRERANDILSLAHHFLRAFARRFQKSPLTLSEPVIERLLTYSWPGNVRELRNALERAVAVCQYNQITVSDLPEEIRLRNTSPISYDDINENLLAIDIIEQRHILNVLTEVKGNKALAAKILKMDRKTLYRKLDRYGYKD